MKTRVLALLLSVLTVPVYAHALGLGSILGQVVDPAGGRIAGAQITATQDSTGLSRVGIADTEGLYVIPSLPPATDSLVFEARGFSTSKQSGALQVDTTTSTLTQVIEQKRLVELPWNGRNAVQLSLLVPGVVNAVNGGADQGNTKDFSRRGDVFCERRAAGHDQLPTGRRELSG